MDIRLAMVPDRDGIIKIEHGDTTFIITVVGYKPGRVADAEPLVELPRRHGRLGPGDKIGPYLNVPRRPDGQIDLEQLLKDYNNQISDPDKLDPSSVLFHAQSADLHEVSRLKQQIAKSMDDLPLTIDFGGLEPFDK